MKQTPLQGRSFSYTGPGDGKDVEHQVIAFTGTHVTTFTNPTEEPHLHGYSWYGTRKEFGAHFKPLI